MLRIIFACFLCLSSAFSSISSSVAVSSANSTAFHVQCSEQGYWYARALSNDLNFQEDLCLPFQDLDSLKPQILLDFFSNRLPKDSQDLNSLKLWSYVCDKNLKISEAENAQLQEDAETLNLELPKHADLFEGIKKFWGITHNTRIHVFLSKSDNKRNNAQALCVSSFIDKDRINSVFVTCWPALGEKMSIADHMGIVAHEFSHSMYEIINKRFASEKFPTIENKIASLPSGNSIIASWYIDETMAVILGNGIFCEKINEKRTDLKGSESCAPPKLIPVIYDLVLRYFDSSKSVDDDFLKEYMRIFDEIYPQAYLDVRMCLAKFFVICPSMPKSQQSEILMEIFKLHPFSGNLVTFDELPAKEKISKDNSTLMVIFDNKEQLKKIADLLPNFDETKPINVVRKNKRMYIFLKTDKDHSFKKLFEELITD